MRTTTKNAIYGAAASSCTSCSLALHPSLATRMKKLCAKLNEAAFLSLVPLRLLCIGPQWKRVSQSAIDLIKKMMTINPKNRISAETALNDVWFTRFETKKASDTMDVLSCIENLQTFKAHSTMHNVVLSYLAVHMINKDEERKLRDIFTSLDRDHNGFLSQEELVEGYKVIFGGDVEAAKVEAKKTMENIDINRNGTVDYNGTM